jgi:SAM-dependent methyltransferase
MDALVKEYLLDLYSKGLMLFGDSPAALCWSPEGQRARYSLLAEIATSLEGIEGKKILDYGCGKGDFYAFLRERGIRVHYTGTDINPDLVALAAAKYPECDFRVFDIEEEELHERFDFIFLCGVFNARVEGATETLKNVIRKLFPHAREGLAVNALSSRAPSKDRELNYVSPAELLDFAVREITPHVTLRHDLSPEDFTLFLSPAAAPHAHHDK